MARSLLVTGGAGFVGVRLCAHLCAVGGYSLTILDNETVGSRTGLAGLPVSFVHGDVRDPAVLDAVLPGRDALIHLAADTRVVESVEDPARNFDVNVVGGFRLLEAARRHGVRQVLSASTGGAILGEAPAPVNEDMPARPLSPYGAAKLAMEGYLSAFAGAYGMATAALRFSNVYGPGSGHKDSVVAAFLREIRDGRTLTVYGDGSQVRDYLYVDDLVLGIRQALEAGARGVYQLGSGRPTRLSELLDAIRTATASGALPVAHAPPRPGEVHTTYCDISRARQAFGFTAPTPLMEGLRRTWMWFQALDRGAESAM